MMYEIGQEGEAMHYLEAGKYTYLAGEINALYHEAAVKMGISDSVQNILYVLCEKGGKCLQSEISKLTGISRQTINSAIRKLEKRKSCIWNKERQKYDCLSDGKRREIYIGKNISFTRN